jgi:hypothetical protein
LSLLNDASHKRLGTYTVRYRCLKWRSKQTFKTHLKATQWHEKRSQKLMLGELVEYSLQSSYEHKNLSLQDIKAELDSLKGLSKVSFLSNSSAAELKVEIQNLRQEIAKTISGQSSFSFSFLLNSSRRRVLNFTHRRVDRLRCFERGAGRDRENF